ncbi:hypothetical protein I4F81_003981 [Pyropia yezoensis]|uniref:Uncharacterized protein n=1 Tax=Pyropia yezoensis TaxID=2788 RepID=A0ACC3BU60_PYRYE|nr:hypothetical protein I4F81_003981 [Neopyropia yezoensis]
MSSRALFSICAAAHKVYPVRIKVVNVEIEEEECLTIAYIPSVATEKGSAGAERSRQRRVGVLQRVLYLALRSLINASHTGVRFVHVTGQELLAFPRVLMYICDQPEERAVLCLKPGQGAKPCSDDEDVSSDGASDGNEAEDKGPGAPEAGAGAEVADAAATAAPHRIANAPSNDLAAQLARATPKYRTTSWYDFLAFRCESDDAGTPERYGQVRTLLSMEDGDVAVVAELVPTGEDDGPLTSHLLRRRGVGATPAELGGPGRDLREQRFLLNVFCLSSGVRLREEEGESGGF